MVYERKRACRCGGVQSGGVCSKCGKSWRAPDKGSNFAPMYRCSRWLKLRLLHLARQPLCVACEREGRVEPAVDVDHIVPHEGDWSKFMDAENLQGLCKKCHGEKTRAEQ